MDDKLTFMLIDDDEDDRMLFEAALKSSTDNVNLLLATDGKEAVEMLASLKQQPPDLVFIDINMPGISGWDCLAAIMANLQIPTMKAIMYSTSNNPRDVEKAMTLGACCFCSKPNTYNGLIRLITLCAENVKKDLKQVLIQEGICFAV